MEAVLKLFNRGCRAQVVCIQQTYTLGLGLLDSCGPGQTSR